MKSPVTSRSPPSSPSFYTYLKPGALAKLRYSKITARSKEIGAQTLFALCQLGLNSDDSQHNPTGLDMDTIPCFNFRVSSSYAPCIQRKKFVAMRPFFSETQL